MWTQARTIGAMDTNLHYIIRSPARGGQDVGLGKRKSTVSGKKDNRSGNKFDEEGEKGDNRNETKGCGPYVIGAG